MDWIESTSSNSRICLLVSFNAWLKCGQDRDVFKQYLRDREMARVAHLLSLSGQAAKCHFQAYSDIGSNQPELGGRRDIPQPMNPWWPQDPGYLQGIIGTFGLNKTWLRWWLGDADPQKARRGSQVSWPDLRRATPPGWVHEGDRSTHDQPHLLGTLPRQSKFELELMNVDELKEKRYSRLGHKAFVSQQIECYMCFTSHLWCSMMPLKVYMHQMRNMNKSWSDPNISGSLRDKNQMSQICRETLASMWQYLWAHGSIKTRSWSQKGQNISRDLPLEEAEPEDLCKATSPAGSRPPTPQAEGARDIKGQGRGGVWMRMIS